MLTRWGREVDPDDPLPEHPRPQLVRPGWRSLNGRWEHAFTASPTRPAAYDGPIVVPFSPEAELSGVRRQLQPDEWLWYRRTFTAPTDAPADAPGHERLLLHLGAVDQSCTVWIDGTEVGSHTGGYLPFTLDITHALDLTDEHTLEIRVRDLSETGYHARGKQRLDRGTIWYTAQSGIWQTVWLEPVPATYAAALVLVPHPDIGALEVTVEADGPVERDLRAEITVNTEGRVVGRARTEPGDPALVRLDEVRLWSPEDPFLYDVEVTLGADRVTSYAAMRSFGTARDDQGHQRLLLNGEPYQHVGVLDQGYWPDGLLTPPSDAAMVADITAMKELGFNLLRKHAKIEPLRWYHHCDRLGMLVWQDVVNGGGRYRYLVADLPATRPVRIPDRLHFLYKRGDAAGREEFRREVRETVELLRNVACVAVWTPFNEGWGQFDARSIAREVARLDPTRLVNPVSGWVDQGGGDLRSFHAYVRPFRMPRRERRAVALTEYGGLSLRIEGHTWSDREFGYRHVDDGDELGRALEELHQPLVAMVPQGLTATVYTQLSDVEDELNGLLTWDREVLKVDPDVVRRITGALRRASGTGR